MLIIYVHYFCIEDEQSAGLIMRHKRNNSMYRYTACTDLQCDHIKV